MDVSADRGPHPKMGRPSVIDAIGVRDCDILAIRRIALTTTLRTDVVSIPLALRIYAAQAGCPLALRNWIIARSSKSYVPPGLREALALPRRLIAHDQAPGRTRLLHEAYCPGTMRLRLDGTRLEAGERQSWDDASANFLLWVDLGGQIRVGRFQLLLGIDDATDYVVGFGFVARERDSYRAEDALGRAMLPAWRSSGAPQGVILERGVWESNRVLECLGALGISRQTSYHPRTKLVESVFHRLWARLGDVPGSVGRSRGENEIGTKLLSNLRAGRLPVQEHCLSLSEAVKRIAAACAAHNSERIESKTYGRWVPAEKWAAESPRHLRPLAAGVWQGLPERRELQVRKGGMVFCRVDDGCGPVELAFGAPELWRYVGSKVAVYFDPAVAEPYATVVEPRTGKVLAEHCELLTGNAGATTDMRRAQTELVRSEHRTLRPDGTLAAWRSEILDTAGSRVTEMQQTHCTPHSRSASAEKPQPARSAPAATRPEPTEDEEAAMLARIEAAERRFQEQGIIPREAPLTV